MGNKQPSPVNFVLKYLNNQGIDQTLRKSKHLNAFLNNATLLAVVDVVLEMLQLVFGLEGMHYIVVIDFHDYYLVHYHF